MIARGSTSVDRVRTYVYLFRLSLANIVVVFPMENMSTEMDLGKLNMKT